MTSELVWVLIRQDDDGGNRYRVARYATKDEAERVADVLDREQRQVYVIERIAPRGVQA
ncbi:SPOR domain-containing protein [Actinacidiphila acididurans]|uniref:SPOR domain-containing protein n=1 Tax=Actinacidiphila acididurans TaxID=2784346 RepID=A0ABS2TXT5_9ACTN|nr:SPOR domain-containing protein [Actinacidiphila acididurans]MBM9507781.1 SPOR domain-containing protein [Actinacidiphila acididurans]